MILACHAEMFSLRLPMPNMAVLQKASRTMRSPMPKKSTASRSKKVRSHSSSKKPVAQTVFQLKVTLKCYKPMIWRRIQIEDCTLDELHEHIQTAMGWTNSHLHHFHIARQPYGDPELMQENFEEFGYKDSTGTKLSDIMPADGKRLKFSYEYDFGDSWDHEIVVEKATEPELGKKYPVCLAGERA